VGYKIEARTVSLKEGGPQGGPAEADGGGRRRQPQARRLSPNLHRFGRGSSVERNENDFFFLPVPLFFPAWCFVLSLEGVRVEKRSDGLEWKAISGRVG